ncbi:SLAM family member 5-like protein [Labeo rohita]|uniref:SLAM family member 5-like protein n=1 Tax=Labeo rohita TaxID=84645 RepID=A0A498MI66_LABRO|nr:SLAM family member 5-like protein [Labeo rohita]
MRNTEQSAQEKGLQGLQRHCNLLDYEKSGRQCVMAAEANEDEITYIEPTFYKRKAQKLDVKEDDHVEYAPIAKRI